MAYGFDLSGAIKPPSICNIDVFIMGFLQSLYPYL